MKAVFSECHPEAFAVIIGKIIRNNKIEKKFSFIELEVGKIEAWSCCQCGFNTEEDSPEEWGFKNKVSEAEIESILRFCDNCL